MSINDAATLAKAANRAGLLTPGQIEEAWDELGRVTGRPTTLCA